MTIDNLQEMDWINPDSNGFIKEDGLKQLCQSGMLDTIYVKQVDTEDSSKAYVIGARITKGGPILKMTTKHNPHQSRIFRSLDAVSSVITKVGADHFIFVV